MPHLAQPLFALLLVPLGIVAIIAWRRRPPTMLVASLAPLDMGAVPRVGRLRSRLPTVFMTAGIAAAIVALMRPQRLDERVLEHREGRDIMLVLDVSGSMKCVDPPEELDGPAAVAAALADGTLSTRFEIAIAELKHFIARRPDDRIGLIGFARHAYTLSPRTHDHQFLIERLGHVEPGMFPDGTGIANALASAVNALRDAPSRQRVAVLVTDGDENIDSAMTPQQAALAARLHQITVYTVGVGSERAFLSVPGLFGHRLLPVPTPLDEALLRAIAEDTGGRFHRARDRDGFAAALAEIDRLEPSPVEVVRHAKVQELFMPWLVASLLLAVLAVLIENTACRTLP